MNFFFKIFLSDGCWRSLDKVCKRNVIVERTPDGKVIRDVVRFSNPGVLAVMWWA